MPHTEPSITIRPALRTDLAALGRLGALLVQMHHAFDPQRFLAVWPGTEQGYASFLGSQLAEPASLLLVAERDGEVLGYTYAAIEGPDYDPPPAKAGGFSLPRNVPRSRRVLPSLHEQVLAARRSGGAATAF